MAKPHSKSEDNINKPTKTERYYTVGYVPRGWTANPPPSIHIKGRWLEQIGFFTGQAITVTIEDGKLIIEPAMQF